MLLEKGLFPNIFNLATHAGIHATSTCGQYGPEYYCKLVEHVSKIYFLIKNIRYFYDNHNVILVMQILKQKIIRLIMQLMELAIGGKALHWVTV